jgi:hypothetical protein
MESLLTVRKLFLKLYCFLVNKALFYSSQEKTVFCPFLELFSTQLNGTQYRFTVIEFLNGVFEVLRKLWVKVCLGLQEH